MSLGKSPKEGNKKHRVVLDTNVLISAILSEGVCHVLLEEANLENIIFHYSPFILGEVEKVLKAKFGLRGSEVQEYMNLIAEAGLLIDPRKANVKIEGICRDPEDDEIIAAAVASSSDFIVTGDSDLLVLKKYEEILIVSPRDFFSKLTVA